MKKVSNIDTYSPMAREQRIKTLVSGVHFNLDRAEFLADLYRTPTFDLGTLKQKVDSEWEKRPISTKFWDVFDTCIGIGFNRPKEVIKEINYRRGNARDSEEWKQPFINLAKKYTGEELEEIRKYILDDAMREYQQAHQLI
jgi:hypothetical protein